MEKRDERGRTQEWQEGTLGRLVAKTFIREKREVKGPYTTADFVMWALNEIFGPSNWSFTILEGPELVMYSDTLGYSKATVRLKARFVNGDEVEHDEVGVWPLRASKINQGGTFETTPPEVYEQVLKSAVTDGLKACTDHIGKCFRPIADNELEGFLIRRQAKADLKANGQSAEGEDPKKSADDLYGEKAEPEPKKAEPKAKKAKKAEPKAKKADADDASSVLEPASYPRTLDELYKMADKELGIGSRDTYAIMQKYLNKKHGEGADIAAYVKTDTGSALKLLWDLVKASITE